MSEEEVSEIATSAFVKILYLHVLGEKTIYIGKKNCEGDGSRDSDEAFHDNIPIPNTHMALTGLSARRLTTISTVLPKHQVLRLLLT